MTDREPWPLLAALDELLARNGWQRYGRLMNERIAHETSTYNFWGMGPRDPASIPDFLGKRDAAAMLEEAVIYEIHENDDIPDVEIVGIEEWTVAWWQEGFGPSRVYVRHQSESAARTRAALEAGWRLGIWPVRGAEQIRIG